MPIDTPRLDDLTYDRTLEELAKRRVIFDAGQGLASEPPL